MSGIRHIVWDWNGTLLDDNHANLDAVNAVCAMFGREPVDLDHWRSVFRRPLAACYADLLGRPLTAAEWAEIDDAYHRSYTAGLPQCRLADGVPDLLTAWAATGRTQSLLSMASHDHLVPLITERGLTAHFARVDGRRFDTEHDSKAEHLAAHLDALGVDPAGVVLIGDIDDDARAAAAVGARALLVAGGMMSRERLEATGHPVVATPAEAVRALAG
ncbi:HAD family hydrolase [Nocardiopsis trehalosi]|jgi:phosphoglycolate phosphatase-like HAD superfamily hydrolase|uniref:HAD family hydrolase n=1 Tax=Nocardiopsis trehalosi TaxID=109329 RepID=UPI000836111B|nr:HAD family hydrolase [Nocardiopsis trehalosi]